MLETGLESLLKKKKENDDSWELNLMQTNFRIF